MNCSHCDGKCYGANQRIIRIATPETRYEWKNNIHQALIFGHSVGNSLLRFVRLLDVYECAELSKVIN